MIDAELGVLGGSQVGGAVEGRDQWWCSEAWLRRMRCEAVMDGDGVTWSRMIFPLNQSTFFGGFSCMKSYIFDAQITSNRWNPRNPILPWFPPEFPDIFPRPPGAPPYHQRALRGAEGDLAGLLKLWWVVQSITWSWFVNNLELSWLMVVN